MSVKPRLLTVSSLTVTNQPDGDCVVNDTASTGCTNRLVDMAAAEVKSDRLKRGEDENKPPELRRPDASGSV